MLPWLTDIVLLITVVVTAPQILLC